MSKNILVLPGGYIGPEIMAEAVKVLEAVDDRFDLGLELEYGLLGGAALDEHGVPLPEETLIKNSQSEMSRFSFLLLEKLSSTPLKKDASLSKS